jgi:hypothetical protein
LIRCGDAVLDDCIADVAKQEMVRHLGQGSIKKSLDVGLYLLKKLAGAAPTARGG